MATSTRSGPSLSRDPHKYFRGIAQARSVIRRVFQLIDECAKGRGLDSLEHQALIQVFGSIDMELPVSRLAESLNVAQPLASRLVKGLVAAGFTERLEDPADQRVTRVRITAGGRGVLRLIEGDVHERVGAFSKTLTEQQRTTVMSIFGFYVGAG